MNNEIVDIQIEKWKKQYYSMFGQYKYNLLIDIDGVVRDLYTLVAKRMGKKVFTYEDGTIIFDIIKENPDRLLQCKLTKYGKTIQKYIDGPVFLTYQKPSWQGQTRKWLDKYFNDYKVIFVNSAKEKLKYFKQAKFIIEDYPYYKDYSKIILINTCYNKNVKHPLVRIGAVKELRLVLGYIIPLKK